MSLRFGAARLQEGVCSDAKPSGPAEIQKGIREKGVSPHNLQGGDHWGRWWHHGLRRPLARRDLLRCSSSGD